MDGSHYISMLIISGISFVFGLFPIVFTIQASRCCPFFLSLILCLGAGVLLATSIVHMLTEVQEKLTYTAQLYFCTGFLILYAFDEIFHFILEGKKIENDREKLNIDTSEKHLYGTIKNSNQREILPLLGERNSEKTNENILRAECSKKSNDNLEKKNFGEGSQTHHHICNDQIQCHIEIGEPCSSNWVAKFGLLIALTMHSLLEGISIGVQTEYNDIFLITGSVTLHKMVLSFCLGLELHSHGVKTIYLVIAILVFSVGSSMGILIGSLVTSDKVFNIDAQIQAIAAGSLLYVAAFEVLPRERFRWQHQSRWRTAGLGQLFFVILGFTCVTFLHLYLVHPHGRVSSSNSTNSVYDNGSEQSPTLAAHAF